MSQSKDPQIRINTFGGNCPVQAEGFVDDKPFYFRARGEHWTMGIGGEPVANPEWFYREEYGDAEYVAGWMAQYEALGFIAKAIGLYAQRPELGA